MATGRRDARDGGVLENLCAAPLHRIGQSGDGEKGVDGGAVGVKNSAFLARDLSVALREFTRR